MKKQKNLFENIACPAIPLTFEFFSLRGLLIKKKLITKEEYKKFLEEGEKEFKVRIENNAELKDLLCNKKHKIDYIG